MTNGDWLRSKGDKEFAEFVMGAILFVLHEGVDDWYENGELNMKALSKTVLEILGHEYKGD